MTKRPLTLSTSITIITLLLTVFNNTVSADQEVITIDGREVLLKDDGSWTYRSTDRYANTKDGQRVRLKEDGSWQYTGNAPLTSTEQVRTTDADIKLQKVVIETYKKKVQKNTHVKTQTVFYINFKSSAQAKNNIRIKQNDISLIEVKDNNGKSYPVISIQPGPVELKPGKETTIVIRAEKSPSKWDDVKSMKIIFKPGVLGIKKQITLSQKIIDFDNKDVDGFGIK